MKKNNIASKTKAQHSETDKRDDSLNFNQNSNSDMPIENTHEVNHALNLKRFAGSIDVSDERGIAGWLIDIDNPVESINVGIFIDNNEVGQVIANKFRDDLQDAGIGTGNCAFFIAMPTEFFDNKEHIIDLRINGEKIIANNCPTKFVLPAQHLASPIPASTKNSDEVSATTNLIQQERNELLLLQLHQMQIEFERYFSKYKKIEAIVHESESDQEKAK